MIRKIIAAWLVIVVLAACRTQPTRKPLFEKDRTFKNERRNTLVAFVGEKIEFSDMPYTPGDFNLGFKAKYKIIKLVYGKYSKDTIEFEAYDHYGTPAFSDYKHALLYVSKYKGKYYHEKYQFDPVFLTRDGRWAGVNLDGDAGDSTAIKPEKIDFREEVSFPIITPDGYDRYDDFKEPYFKRTGNKAVVLYGNYLVDLFRLKRDGVLTARELFGKKRKRTPLVVRDIQLEEVAAPSPAEDSSMKLIDTYLGSLTSTGRVPGIAVSVSLDGRTTYEKAIGFKNIQTGEKLHQHYGFNASFISQSFTAAAILRLAERKMLDINQPVINYLPYFRMADERYKFITIKQMLNHTSGLPDVKDFEWEKAIADSGAAERYVRSLDKEKLISDPGKEFHFSNMAYNVLGDVIAKLSEVPFETFVEAAVINPGDIRGSFEYPLLKASWLTSPHTGNPAKVSPVYPYNRMHAPSSTLSISTGALSDWAQFTMCREVHGRSLLSPEMHAMQLAPTFVIDSAAQSYVALGWFMSKRHGQIMYEQGGHTLGFSSLVAFIPEKNITISILCNYDGFDLKEARDEILKIIFAK
jgi:CubicO group peptidase (beta-lactamase class C family)